MNEAVVLGLARESLMVALLVGAPILGISLVVGVVVSIFQAVTQVHEMTLTYVPKMLAAGAVMALLGNWMLQQLVSYMLLCFDHAARVAQ